jgi:hypothetical protein
MEVRMLKFPVEVWLRDHPVPYVVNLVGTVTTKLTKSLVKVAYASADSEKVKDTVVRMLLNDAIAFYDKRTHPESRSVFPNDTTSYGKFPRLKIVRTIAAARVRELS